MIGWGGQLRATWFSRDGGRRALHHAVATRSIASPARATGRTVTAVRSEATGLYVGGWAFRPRPHQIDVRTSASAAMYMRFDVPTGNGPTGVDTVFFSGDLVVAYRL